MSKRFLLSVTVVATLVAAAFVPAPAQAQTCEPLYNGRIADVFYQGTAIFWEPVVEYRQMVLTIGGPCEDIVRVFGPNDQIFFDLRDIQRLTDGQYTWELHRESTIDEGIQNELSAARGSGEEDALWWSYFQAGLIPDGPYVDSGRFTVVRGEIIDPDQGVEKSAALTTRAGSGPAANPSAAANGTVLAAGFSEAAIDGSGAPPLATRATVLTNADGVIRNSLCVGFDCPNSPSFSDTTILLMENNTRIKFDDTSTLNSFPRNDWEIEANSNLNGGASYLGFNDCGQSSQGGCATDLVFAVEAGARQNALYVESDGDVGFGTANPVVRLHTIDGDTPTLRLEQDGSSGFAPQTWDVAGNETSFFVRDATNGSTLPFRIRPGAASNSLVIDTDDDVGVGVLSPSASLHVRRTSGDAQVFVEEASGTEAVRTMMQLTNNGRVRWQMTDSSANGQVWTFFSAEDEFNISSDSTAGQEFQLQGDGDLTITGTLTTGGPTCSSGCDQLFQNADQIESIEEHSAFMWENSHLPGVGPTPEGAPINLSEKTGGILNELEKAHIYIEQLHGQLQEKDAQLAGFQERLSRLEQLLLAQEGDAP